MQAALLAPGETTYADFYSPTGSRLIHARIDRHDTHTAITVAHTSELDRTFANPADADRYLTWLQTEVKAGTRLCDIVDRAGVLTSAAAVFDELADEVLENAKPATLADFRQQHRATPTRSNVHCKPLTPAEKSLIRSHVEGVVTTRPGQSWLILRAIVRRGYATPPDGHPQGRKYTTVHLNARGMAAIETEELAA